MWRTGLFEVGFIGFESRQSCRLCRSSSKEISVLGWINGGLRRVCATLPHSVSSDFVTAALDRQGGMSSRRPILGRWPNQNPRLLHVSAEHPSKSN